MKTRTAFVLAGWLAACGGGGDDDGTVDDVTYFQDVKPIIDAKCTNCHTAQGIAPFALETYAEVQAEGVGIELNVREGTMPPWPPNPDCNEYVADRSLTQDQKDLISAWFEGGMLEGDPDQEADPLDVERVELSRVDLELAMNAEYTPQTTEDYPDEYRCFVLKFPDSYTTTKYVTGFRAVPGNPKVVHHVIAFYATPDQVAAYEDLDAAEAGDGYTCFGGPGGPIRGTMLGGWAPGSLGNDFPAGTGLAIEPGSAVIMQVHYNVVEAGVEPDLTGVEMKIDDQVEKIAQIMPWTNPGWLDSQAMHIPAGDADVMHTFQYDASAFLGGDFTIYSANMHQHNLGTRNSAVIERGGGGTDCLLQIDDWDFHWQGSYGLREPLTFHAGDQLSIECHWDNSAENQPVIDGEPAVPQDVYWGEDTQSEMCIGFFYVTPL